MCALLMEAECIAVQKQALNVCRAAPRTEVVLLKREESYGSSRICEKIDSRRGRQVYVDR